MKQSKLHKSCHGCTLVICKSCSPICDWSAFGTDERPNWKTPPLIPWIFSSSQGATCSQACRVHSSWMGQVYNACWKDYPKDCTAKSRMILHQEGQTCKQCRPFVKGGEQNHKTRSVCEQQLLKRKDNPKQIETVYRWSTHHLSSSSTTEPVRPRSMTGH